ncbi:mannonate dehydratase [Bacillus sp. B15-48]|uniref:mannonate dehydratase n=1 Tax=Bacillus sp. B15-48 TaxID=1548601 RepID=UPI00193F3DCC|nr:mannonate dehydratase [Bacillus sp. B15-48]MBM4761652.1 mannonate dehydratase [Bacillus sp. B15-48]
MNMTFRWYGRGNDTVKLEHVKQIPGVKGIVWALHDKPVGERWTEAEIKAEVDYIQSFGFHAEVVESVNIHEAIKLGNEDRDLYIENYKQTIRHLGKYGVKVICYNFMPIFDWTRSDLFKELPDGSTALFYEKDIVEGRDPQELIEIFSSYKEMTLPGWEPEKIAKIKELFQAYEGMTEEQLWENLAYFLKAILPVAEQSGIKMAIHPDDPPWSIFGLPRIMTGRSSLKKLLSISDSPSNGITFCTGSLGSNRNNDVVALAEEFAKSSPFAHVRNIRIFENGDFIETSHLTEDGSLNISGVMKVLSGNEYQGYLRPDHGRHIWGEKCRPGYGLYDRALGIMHLLGLWDAYQSLKGGK